MSEALKIDIFRVPGISCQHCVHAVTESLNGLSGVREVQVNLAEKSVRVAHAPALTIGEMVAAINDAGYEEVSVLA